MTNEYSIDGITLRQRIEAMPEDCILFRSDFPEYHTEFVGSILSELTTEGILVKIAHGIYTKPRKSKFGVVLPSVDKVVQAIATRDNAEVLPSGMTALNFCYGTRLISLLVQALKALKKENVGDSELNVIRQLVFKETDKDTLVKDVDMMPAWMKRIIKPMITA